MEGQFDIFVELVIIFITPVSPMESSQSICCQPFGGACCIFLEKGCTEQDWFG